MADDLSDVNVNMMRGKGDLTFMAGEPVYS